MNIVYVVSSYDFGGASRTLAATAHMLIDSGASVSVLCLSEPAHSNKPLPLGARWSDGSDLAHADVVLIQFGNTPAIHRFLRRRHPPMRVVMWLQVEGGTRPHVITQDVVEFADTLVTTASSTLALKTLEGRDAVYIPAWVDIDHFSPRASSEAAYTAGYMGTVDFTKMHPDYVAMSAAVPDQDVRFSVWGFGNAYPSLKAHAASLGQSHRFQFCGTTSDPAAALADMRVFGYPLCEDSYATNDRALQEAMAMALPSVVLDRPGLRDLAIDGVTALVAKSKREYAQAIVTLKRNAGLANSLGRNARERIQLHFNPAKGMQRLHQTFVDALSRPKRIRAGTAGTLSGAALFVASLGPFAGEFARNLASFARPSQSDRQSGQDEEAIAAASPGLCNPGGGGVLDYRSAYPDDPILRFWSGLIFSRQGRHAVAFSEFLTAMRLGLPPARVANYLASVGRQCGMSEQTLAHHAAKPARIDVT